MGILPCRKRGNTAAVESGAAAATDIALTGSGATVTGDGAAAVGGEVQITADGSYTVHGTLQNGRIVVNAPKQTVHIVLDGVDITCQNSAPVYIVHAAQVTLTLAEGSENRLADGKTYTYADEFSSEEDDEPNACLYSKTDLVIDGGGKLTVSGNARNGITSKDTLTIADATLSVTAVNHGINGKDALVLNNAAITVHSGGDALRSTNDSGEQNDDGQTLGFVATAGGTLTLTAGEDGIQAESTLSVRGSTLSVTTAGDADKVSAKGLKAGSDIRLEGGTYTLSCTDDAIHSNQTVSVRGGKYTITSGDDALHADNTLTVVGGLLTVEKCYEGLEGSSVAILGGVIRINAGDDGINAAGGADASGGFRGNGKADDKQWGQMARPDTGGERPTPPGGMDAGGEQPTPPDGMGVGGEQPNPPGGSSSESNSYTITVSGGYTVVCADGDGMDSNGSIAMTGGTVIVYGPTNSGNGALDYDSSFSQSGGTVIAAGSSGMAQAPSEISGRGLSVAFDSTLPAESCASLSAEDGSVLVLRLPKNTQHLVFCSTALSKTGTLTVSTGVTVTGGTEKDGVITGAAVSGGTLLTELKLTDGKIATYGFSGAMGGGGRPGGGHGAFGGGQNRG